MRQTNNKLCKILAKVEQRIGLYLSNSWHAYFIENSISGKPGYLVFSRFWFSLWSTCVKVGFVDCQSLVMDNSYPKGDDNNKNTNHSALEGGGVWNMHLFITWLLLIKSAIMYHYQSSLVYFLKIIAMFPSDYCWATGIIV